MSSASIHPGDQFCFNDGPDRHRVRVLAPLLSAADWWACEDVESKDQFIVHSRRLQPVSEGGRAKMEGPVRGWTQII
jgi:hypothetical protein